MTTNHRGDLARDLFKLHDIVLRLMANAVWPWIFLFAFGSIATFSFLLVIWLMFGENASELQRPRRCEDGRATCSRGGPAGVLRFRQEEDRAYCAAGVVLGLGCMCRLCWPHFDLGLET